MGCGESAKWHSYLKRKTLTIKSILISQPIPSSDQKSPFIALTELYNVAVDYSPFIVVDGVTLKEFISQRVKILDHTAVIFTSRLLIDNFFRIVGENRLTIPDSLKYFCTSEAIALYLQKYIVYRKRKIFFAAGSVTSLMEMILKHASERYLLPLSEPHKPEIPLAMEKAGLSHSRVILSHTRCADMTALDPSKYDIVALYSPSEVKNYRESFLSRGYKGKLAVFGEATARVALAEGLIVDLMAPSPQFPSMASALMEYCKRDSNGGDMTDLEVSSLGVESQSELLKMAERRKSRVRKSLIPAAAAGAKRPARSSATPRAVSNSVGSKTLVKK